MTHSYFAFILIDFRTNLKKKEQQVRLSFIWHSKSLKIKFAYQNNEVRFRFDHHKTAVPKPLKFDKHANNDQVHFRQNCQRDDKKILFKFYIQTAIRSALG